MEIALTAFGLPHLMGSLPTASGEKHPLPLGMPGLMELAVELGFGAIEAPIPSPDMMALETLRAELLHRGLRMVPAYGIVLDRDADHLREHIKHAAYLGAPVMRLVISKVLCGDRRRLSVGWDTYLNSVAERLKEVLPEAAEQGVCLALENHQDATSADFIRLAEMLDFSPYFGVTLDAGNPLAVGECPVEYASRIAPLIRHLHLKDYTIHFAPEGYRLVRCAAGDGVIDFPAILAIARSNGRPLLPGMEIGAQATRTIPVLDDDWWDHYSPEQRDHLPAALAILQRHGLPEDRPYSSAWERGEDSPAVSREEMDIIVRSAEYFRGRF